MFSEVVPQIAALVEDLRAVLKAALEKQLNS
jgi:hypothetical protein